MKKNMTLREITIQTDTHGKDVDAAATDDDQIAFVVFACQKTFFIYYVKLCLLWQLKPDERVVQYVAVRTSIVMYVHLCLVIV